jgi:hypothetical protein
MSIQLLEAQELGIESRKEGLDANAERDMARESSRDSEEAVSKSGRRGEMGQICCHPGGIRHIGKSVVKDGARLRGSVQHQCALSAVWSTVMRQAAARLVYFRCPVTCHVTLVTGMLVFLSSSSLPHYPQLTIAMNSAFQDHKYCLASCSGGHHGQGLIKLVNKLLDIFSNLGACPHLLHCITAYSCSMLNLIHMMCGLSRWGPWGVGHAPGCPWHLCLPYLSSPQRRRW